MNKNTQILITLTTACLMLLSACSEKSKKDGSAAPAASVAPTSSGGGASVSPILKAPVPGNTGKINLVQVQSSSVKLSWTAASDEDSEASDEDSEASELRYGIFFSSTSNISSVADAEVNGNLETHLRTIQPLEQFSA